MGKEPAEHPIGNGAEPSGSWLAKQGVEAESAVETRGMKREQCGPGVEVRGEPTPHEVALGLGTLKFACSKGGLKTRAEG